MYQSLFLFSFSLSSCLSLSLMQKTEDERSQTAHHQEQFIELSSSSLCAPSLSIQPIVVKGLGVEGQTEKSENLRHRTVFPQCLLYPLATVSCTYNEMLMEWDALDQLIWTQRSHCTKSFGKQKVDFHFLLVSLSSCL